MSQLAFVFKLALWIDEDTGFEKPRMTLDQFKQFKKKSGEEYIRNMTPKVKIFITKIAAKYGRDDIIREIDPTIPAAFPNQWGANSTSRCVYCRKRKSNVIVIPCQHKYQCQKCYIMGTRICRLCKSNIEYAVKVTPIANIT